MTCKRIFFSFYIISPNIIDEGTPFFYKYYIDNVKIPKENTVEELQQRQCKELEQMMEWEVNSFIRNWKKKRMEILNFTCNYTKVTEHDV